MKILSVSGCGSFGWMLGVLYFQLSLLTVIWWLWKKGFTLKMCTFCTVTIIEVARVFLVCGCFFIHLKYVWILPGMLRVLYFPCFFDPCFSFFSLLKSAFWNCWTLYYSTVMFHLKVSVKAFMLQAMHSHLIPISIQACIGNLNFVTSPSKAANYTTSHEHYI